METCSMKKLPIKILQYSLEKNEFLDHSHRNKPGLNLEGGSKLYTKDSNDSYLLL